ncbi:MAG: transglutaminase [Rhodoferax sp.]|nr:transglutaminase [Rhodoferax sp.]
MLSRRRSQLAALAALAALPREGRDTLFLLLVIAWVLLPQVGNLPLWCSLFAASLLTARGWLAWRSRPLPSRWWMLALLAATLAATWATHRTLLGRDPGVTLIVVLLALKTLELRARRDAFVIFFLSFFTMLTNFFFSQSLATAAAMLIALLGLLTALVMAHMPVGKPPLAEAARTAGWMTLLGAPVMLVLFMLFPRMAPLWGIPSDGMAGRSGLSGVMQVGSMASLALDDGIALRVRFEGETPAQRDLYFRGPVLSQFDGREWRPQYTGFGFENPRAANLRVAGPAVRYEVTLEPHNRPWLLLLDAAPRPPQVSGDQAGRVFMTPDLQWMTSRPLTDLTRYKAESHPDFRHGPERQALSLQTYVELPPGFNPRTLQLAADLRRDPRHADLDTAGFVAIVLERLRAGGYVYTLEPGPYGQHTADEFWFDTKAGFCEHIASSFVILMRALDIPARIVTGYQGGDINPVDGFWTVRQSDAHAWAEVWQAGQGWVRVDPTGAVSPGRVGTLQRLQPPAGVLATAIGSVNRNLALNLRAAWEAVNNRWNQWVLNYTQTRQLDLLKRIGLDVTGWEDLSRTLAAVIAAVALLGGAWALWDRRQHDPWLRLLVRAQTRFRAAGIDVAPTTPPRQMAVLLQQRFAGEAGDPAADVRAWQAWLLDMEAQRYAAPSRGGERPGVARLRRAFRQLAWPLPTTASTTASATASPSASAPSSAFASTR